MSRAKGTANLAASLEVLAGAPLDAREKVPTKADLYLASNFPYPYIGLETYVVSENKKYRLIGNDVTVEANWEEVGSGGGGGTTVIANPEGEATDELDKLQVGNDIFSIPQGGSGADTEIIADDFDATKSYAVDDYVVYEGTLYKCTTDHTGEWNASDFDATQVMEEMPTPMPAEDMSDIVTPLPSVMSRRFKYSTEEQVIGEWIDGKPVYEKTFSRTGDTTISPFANYCSCDSTIGTILHVSPLIRTGVSPIDAINYIGARRNGSYLQLTAPNQVQTSSSSYVTIRYTKTTD